MKWHQMFSWLQADPVLYQGRQDLVFHPANLMMLHQSNMIGLEVLQLFADLSFGFLSRPSELAIDHVTFAHFALLRSRQRSKLSLLVIPNKQNELCRQERSGNVRD